MLPALSLIIPLHNHKDKLPRLLNSVLVQKGLDLKTVLELIIVDDASDEPCDDIVHAYSDRGLNIRVLRHASRRHTKNARLTGVKNAKGRIIAFADADDMLWGTDALGAHIRMFEDHDADIVHFRSLFTDEHGNFVRYYALGDPFAFSLEAPEIFGRYLSTDIRGTSMWNKLYSRDLFLSLYDRALQSNVLWHGEDLCLTALCMLHAKKYIGSDMVGYGYHYVHKGRQDIFERAVFGFKLLEEMTEYMAHLGCAGDLIEKYTRWLEHYIALCMGHVCLDIGKSSPTASNAVIDGLLQSADTASLIKLLILGNRVNAEKIVPAFHLLQSGRLPSDRY